MSGGMEECARLREIDIQAEKEARASDNHYKRELMEKRIGRIVLSLFEAVKIYNEIKD